MPALSDAQRRVAEFTTLSALTQILNRGLDLREALEAALPHIVELVGLQTGWIFLREEDGFRLAARHNLPPAIAYPSAAWQNECTCQDECLGGRLAGVVVAMRCSRLRYAVGDKRSLAQHASVPLHNGDAVVGILNVATTEFGRFNAATMQLLMAIGDLLGTAIARAWLHEQVTVRRVQEQAALLKLSQDLLVGGATSDAMQRLARVGARLLGVDACAFIQADEPNGKALLVAAHGWRLPAGASLPLVVDAVNPHMWYLPERSAALASDSHGPLPPLLRTQRFRGHMALDVQINGAPIGTLMVNTLAQRQFFDDEAQLLGLLGSQVAQLIERERLHQDALVAQRLEQELDFARTTQTSFLPAHPPEVAGYSIAAFYHPARQVGGDFYDFIRVAEGDGEQLGLVIADVTGKGIPAALFMVLSRTLLRATASDARPPSAVLETVNRLILEEARAEQQVTCFYGVLSPTTHQLVFASAGHVEPLLYRASLAEIEPLQARGTILGIIPEATFGQRTAALERGDVLLLYTDGVTEAMTVPRRMFGTDRLTALLGASAHLGPQAIIERVVAAVQVFTAGAPQHDDITLVVVKRE